MFCDSVEALEWSGGVGPECLRTTRDSIVAPGERMTSIFATLRFDLPGLQLLRWEAYVMLAWWSGFAVSYCSLSMHVLTGALHITCDSGFLQSPGETGKLTRVAQ